MRPHHRHSSFCSKQKSLHVETPEMPLHPPFTTSLHKGQKGKRSTQKKLPNTAMTKLSSPDIPSTSGKVTKLWVGRDKVIRGCLAWPCRNSSPGKLPEHQLSRRNSCTAAKRRSPQLVSPVPWYRPTDKHWVSSGHEELIVINLWFLQVKGCWWIGGTLCWDCPCHISLTPWMRTEGNLQSLVHLKHHTKSTKSHHLWYFLKCQEANFLFPRRTVQNIKSARVTVHNNCLLIFFSIQMVTFCSQKPHFIESKFYQCIFPRTSS